MKKKLVLVACLLSIAITGCGKQKMNNEETSHEDSEIKDMPWMELVQTYPKTDYVFEEWRDTETGVHYIVYKYRGTSYGDGVCIGGICPRYMNGTSVYTDAPESSVSRNSLIQVHNGGLLCKFLQSLH